jgi:hypothetical protein
MKNIAFTFGAVVFTLGMIGNNVILGSDVKADKNVVAVVNGEEVNRDRLAEMLIDIYGNEGLGMLIRRTLVKQESIKHNVTVTEKEIAERIEALVGGKIRQEMKKGGLKDEEALKRELEKAELTIDQYKKNIQKSFKLSNGRIEAELLAEKIIKQTIKRKSSPGRLCCVLREMQKETLRRLKPVPILRHWQEKSLLTGALPHVEVQCARLDQKELLEKK